jgi:hypothetical protein
VGDFVSYIAGDGGGGVWVGGVQSVDGDRFGFVDEEDGGSSVAVEADESDHGVCGGVDFIGDRHHSSGGDGGALDGVSDSGDDSDLCFCLHSVEAEEHDEYAGGGDSGGDSADDWLGRRGRKYF